MTKGDVIILFILMISYRIYLNTASCALRATSIHKTAGEVYGTSFHTRILYEQLFAYLSITGIPLLLYSKPSLSNTQHFKVTLLLISPTTPYHLLILQQDGRTLSLAHRSYLLCSHCSVCPKSTSTLQSRVQCMFTCTSKTSPPILMTFTLRIIWPWFQLLHSGDFRFVPLLPPLPLFFTPFLKLPPHSHPLDYVKFHILIV